jgi:hypothetical protein
MKEQKASFVPVDRFQQAAQTVFQRFSCRRHRSQARIDHIRIQRRDRVPGGLEAHALEIQIRPSVRPRRLRRGRPRSKNVWRQGLGADPAEKMSGRARRGNNGPRGTSARADCRGVPGYFRDKVPGSTTPGAPVIGEGTRHTLAELRFPLVVLRHVLAAGNLACGWLLRRDCGGRRRSWRLRRSWLVAARSWPCRDHRALSQSRLRPGYPPEGLKRLGFSVHPS